MAPHKKTIPPNSPIKKSRRRAVILSTQELLRAINRSRQDILKSSESPEVKALKLQGLFEFFPNIRLNVLPQGQTSTSLQQTIVKDVTQLQPNGVNHILGCEASYRNGPKSFTLNIPRFGNRR